MSSGPSLPFKAPFAVSPVLLRVTLRYLLAQRWQSALMILGIALGVAVVVAVDLANASAWRAFELSKEAVVGRATHTIQGGPAGLDEQVYIDLRRGGIDGFAAPITSNFVSSPQLGNRPLELLGIDPFADYPFRDYLNGGQTAPGQAELLTFLTQPGALLLSQEMADQYGIEVGDELLLEVAGFERNGFAAAFLQPQDDLARRALSGMLLADIATAQELTGQLGKLDRIDLILPVDEPQAAAVLQEGLPNGYRVQPSGSRSDTLEQMTAAFRLNLSALSLLALLVGLFLIYNTMTFSVVRRRPLFGMLRCLGVTRREIFAAVLAEAAAVGFIGSVLGLGLGVLMGRQTVGMVSQTINDLYYTTTVQSVGLPVESLIKGGLVGLLATIITAIIPAREAATSPPRAVLSRSGLESRVSRTVFWTAGGGLLAVLLGFVMFRFSERSLFLGFGGTLVVVMGFAMMSAAVMVGLMRLAAPLLGRLFGLLGRMAPRSLTNSLSRTSVAVAALMLAVAVAIGMSLMIASFRHSVSVWLEQTLHGDIYISAPGFISSTPTEPVDPGVVETVENWPQAQAVYILRAVFIDSPDGTVLVNATSNPDLGNERLYLELRVDPDEVGRLMAEEEAVIVSEALAYRLDLFDPQKKLSLYTLDGWHDFPVVGIFSDYSSSQGSLWMGNDRYRALWQDQRVTALDIRLKQGIDPDQAARQLQESMPDGQRLVIRPNQSLREDVLEVFERTFAITGALQVLATVVAFIGVLNTLLLLQIEKQREMGILRTLGLSSKQLWQLVMLETGLMGLVSGLLAFPTGYTLTLILIYVINRRSFGWTLQQSVEAGAFLQALAVALLAALLAGIYPARRLSRMTAAEAVRYE